MNAKCADARLIARRVACLVAAILCSAFPALADDFYKGKTVRMIISGGVASGYDVYARTVAHHWQRHIPGNPTIVPQNMTGAGGLVPANHLYNVAVKDGTVVAAVQNTVPFEPLFGNKSAMFDAAKFGWIGTPTTEAAVYITYYTSQVKTVGDAQKYPMTVGSVGANSTHAFYARIFNQILGMKAKLVNGYPGSTEIALAMERGEIDGTSAPFWTSLKTQRPDWYPKKLANFLLQYGARSHPELPDVPFALDLVKKEQDRTLLIAASAPLALGRPFAVPPDVPADRLDILRKSFLETMRDPEFIKDCESQHIECGDVHTGPELAATIKQIYDMPADMRDRLVAMYADTSLQ
jgi:tripartite-type tricarboxylate transporter receptor subunit TctC